MYNNRYEPIEGIEYQPPIMRCKYQISIWKFDQYGLVKIKDRYFNIKNEPKPDDISSSDDFTLQLDTSIDSKNIVVKQSKTNLFDTQIVLVLDPYSLEILSETVVSVIDNSFVDHGQVDFYD